jgi:hypothetical protein
MQSSKATSHTSPGGGSNGKPLPIGRPGRPLGWSPPSPAAMTNVGTPVPRVQAQESTRIAPVRPSSDLRAEIKLDLYNLLRESNRMSGRRLADTKRDTWV